MPCFVRILRRLGIDFPTSPEFNAWIESELMKQFDVASHEELRNALTYYETFYPEKFKEIVENILRKWRKKEELAVV